jgi:hypothetical protein
MSTPAPARGTPVERELEAMLLRATRSFIAGASYAGRRMQANVTAWPDYNRSEFIDIAQGRVWNELLGKWETITGTVAERPTPSQITGAEYVLSWLKYIPDEHRRRLVSTLLRQKAFREHGAAARTRKSLRLNVDRTTVWRQYNAGLAEILAGLALDNVDMIAARKNIL